MDCVAASYPKKKKIFHFQMKARSKVTSSGNTKNHRNIAHNKLELKRKKIEPKIKQTKVQGLKFRSSPLKPDIPNGAV